MRGRRLLNQIVFFAINNPYKRAEYIRENNIFHHMGTSVAFQPRKMPLYGELISVGNNVVIGSDVSFCTHDGMNSIFERMGYEVSEKVGCIKIGDNCFIGAGAIILYDVNIGNNSVVAAGAVINQDVPPGSVVGVPGKVIGWTDDIIRKYEKNRKISVYKENIDAESIKWYWKDFYRRNQRG